MTLYGSYDTFYQNNPTPRELGGRSRAVKAKRDKFGRFMPDREIECILWELPAKHGREGGLKRAATGARVNGRYVKEGNNARI